MGKEPEKQAQEPQQERRRFKRISKNFVMTYHDLDKPDEKFEITQLRNISMGGMCFITTRDFAPGTHIGVELNTPYLSETTHLEGTVLESHEKVQKMIYETRLQFDSLKPEAEFLLTKLIEFFINEENGNNE